MSLVKTYAVACEGPTLAERLRLLNRLGSVQWSYHGHQSFSGYATSSKRARLIARQNDWGRVTVTLPIITDQPSAGSTDQKFDLCPSCTLMLKDVK